MFSKFEVFSLLIVLISAISAVLIDKRDQSITRQQVAEQLGTLEQRQIPKARFLREPTACI